MKKDRQLKRAGFHKQGHTRDTKGFCLAPYRRKAERYKVAVQSDTIPGGKKVCGELTSRPADNRYALMVKQPKRLFWLRLLSWEHWVKKQRCVIVYSLLDRDANLDNFQVFLACLICSSNAFSPRSRFSFWQIFSLAPHFWDLDYHILTSVCFSLVFSGRQRTRSCSIGQGHKMRYLFISH